jgi:pyrroloquinoline quinone biosynthesis protein B
MARFLEANRPWGWLVERGQVSLEGLTAGESFDFDGLAVTPFASPHRAEDTDTIGVEVRGAGRRLVYLPDADHFPDEIVARIDGADVALVDGTFYDATELPGRDLSEIPHPFVSESVVRLAGACRTVHFTHLNHTNRLLDPDPGCRPSLPSGFAILEDGAVFDL